MRARVLLLVTLLAAPAAAEPAFDPFGDVGIDADPGARVPLDQPLADADGAATTLRALADGRPILLAPVVHDCPNICGVTLAGLAQAIANQPFTSGDDFVVVALGIDPRETPAAARGALAALSERFPELAQSGGLHAVVGAKADVAALTGALGFRYAWDPQIDQYAHAAATAVLTGDGRLSRWLYGVAPDPTDLQLALTEAGEGTIGGLADQLLLLCYRYDPATGRYAPLAWTLLRAGGLGVVGALAGFVGWSLWRERRARPS